MLEDSANWGPTSRSTRRRSASSHSASSNPNSSSNSRSAHTSSPSLAPAAVSLAGFPGYGASPEVKGLHDVAPFRWTSASPPSSPATASPAPMNSRASSVAVPIYPSPALRAEPGVGAHASSSLLDYGSRGPNSPALPEPPIGVLAKSRDRAASAADHEDEAAAAAADEEQPSMWPLLAVFACAVIVLVVLYRHLPTLPPEESKHVRLPRSIAHVKELAKVLTKYRDHHFAVVVGFFSAVYVFLQAFAIPGALFLSILAGPLFGLAWGLFIVSALATTGSSICFLISKTLGKGVVKRSFPALLQKFRGMLASHHDNLFFYLLFLRISPLLPNWFISVSSPILGIPWHLFAGATFLGLLPGNYLHISTGLALNSLSGDGPMVNYRAIATLFFIALLALIPVLCKKRFERYNDAAASKHNNFVD